MDIAFANLYKLAVFVRGDYDQRDVADDEKTKLLNLVLSSFRDVQTKSESAFTDLSRIHEKVSAVSDGHSLKNILTRSAVQSTELRDSKLVRLEGTLKDLAEQVKVQLEGLEKTISDAKSNIEELDKSLADAQENMKTLRDKQESARKAAIAADIGVSSWLPECFSPTKSRTQ